MGLGDEDTDEHPEPICILIPSILVQHQLQNDSSGLVACELRLQGRKIEVGNSGKFDLFYLDQKLVESQELCPNRPKMKVVPALLVTRCTLRVVR